MDSFVIGGEGDNVCLHVGVCDIQDRMDQEESIDLILTSKNTFVFVSVSFIDDLLSIIKKKIIITFFIYIYILSEYGSSEICHFLELAGKTTENRREAT